MPAYFKCKVKPPTETRGTKILTVNIENRARAVTSWDHELESLADHFPRADFLFDDNGWSYFVGHSDGKAV